MSTQRSDQALQAQEETLPPFNTHPSHSQDPSPTSSFSPAKSHPLSSASLLVPSTTLPSTFASTPSRASTSSTSAAPPTPTLTAFHSSHLNPPSPDSAAKHQSLSTVGNYGHGSVTNEDNDDDDAVARIPRLGGLEDVDVSITRSRVGGGGRSLAFSRGAAAGGAVAGAAAGAALLARRGTQDLAQDQAAVEQEAALEGEKAGEEAGREIGGDMGGIVGAAAGAAAALGVIKAARREGGEVVVKKVDAKIQETPANWYQWAAVGFFLLFTVFTSLVVWEMKKENALTIKTPSFPWTLLPSLFSERSAIDPSDIQAVVASHTDELKELRKVVNSQAAATFLSDLGTVLGGYNKILYKFLLRDGALVSGLMSLQDRNRWQNYLNNLRFWTYGSQGLLLLAPLLHIFPRSLYAAVLRMAQFLLWVGFSVGWVYQTRNDKTRGYLFLIPALFYSLQAVGEISLAF